MTSFLSRNLHPDSANSVHKLPPDASIADASRGEDIEMTPVAGSSSGNGDHATHDYTEGATPIEINQALVNARRSRRDSQYSTYYDGGGDGDGSMFSGPGHSVNPSSVSRMSRIEMGRRSSDMRTRTRRQSVQSGRLSLTRSISRGSAGGDGESRVFADDESGGDLYASDGGEDDIASSRRKRRRRSTSPPPRSMFGNLANLFSTRAESPPPRGGRRSRSRASSRISGRSRRSDAVSEQALLSDDDGEERWGYSSGEEDSEEEGPGIDNASITASMQYDSDFHEDNEDESRIPLLDMDPLFGGEARVDMEMSTLLEPPPLGPPSRQTIYIEDEDSTVRFVGYEAVPSRVWIWRLGCILSCGILALFGHWFPNLWLRWVTKERAFIDIKDGFVVVEVSESLWQEERALTFEGRI